MFLRSWRKRKAVAEAKVGKDTKSAATVYWKEQVKLGLERLPYKAKKHIFIFLGLLMAGYSTYCIYTGLTKSGQSRFLPPSPAKIQPLPEVRLDSFSKKSIR